MPLIEDLGRSTGGTIKPSVSYGYAAAAAPAFATRFPESRKRTVYQTAADSSSRQRAIARRIAELEKENYHDAKIDIPPIDLVPEVEAAQKKTGARAVGATINSRRILSSKKTLQNHLDDDPANAKVFRDGAADEPKYPPNKMCSICGYWGKVTCVRCGAKYCGIRCEATHRETRCLKIYG
ncbi:hypothetical protein TRVA0_065S00562 [Trichomonascus vanleenenianus]|uniref:zinc finger HIT domain-containing protein n=1 Tax=Trichomonascus vanleenenianus TaxID=2268995 RepID=UPI003ECAA03C